MNMVGDRHAERTLFLLYLIGRVEFGQPFTQPDRPLLRRVAVEQVRVLVKDRRQRVLLAVAAGGQGDEVFVMTRLEVARDVRGLAVVKRFERLERRVALEDDDRHRQEAIGVEAEQLREDEVELLDLQRQLARLVFIGVTDDVEVLGGQLNPLVFGQRRRSAQDKEGGKRDKRNSDANRLHIQLQGKH